MARFKLWQGDITTLRVDAIVNAANTTLLGGGGVDGAIHSAAGPELLDACRELHGCATGEAKITPGFKLPAKYVIHTPGPVWQGGGAGEVELLTRSYQNSLKLAEENGCQSIAFPAISTGVYHFPVSLAARVAISVINAYCALQHYDPEIILVAYNDATFREYERALADSRGDKSSLSSDC